MVPRAQTNGKGGTQGPQETTPLLWDVAWRHFMLVCGIFPVKSHKNIEIAEHGNAILRSFRLRIAPNKKTRQEVWYLNDTFPTFPKAGRSIQTDLQPNTFRYRNVSCTEISRQRRRRLERASTSPETLVFSNCNSYAQRHESPLNTSNHVQKVAISRVKKCLSSFLKVTSLS